MISVVFLGGIFPDDHKKEIIEKSNAGVQFAADLLQKKLIKGLGDHQDIDLKVVSLPFLSVYPNGYRDRWIPGWGDKENVSYVGFDNCVLLRNISRTINLYRHLKKEKMISGQKKWIIVYSAHTPFNLVATYLKKKSKELRIAVIVPDLPIHMSDTKSRLYWFMKRIDSKVFQYLCKNVDAFIPLTEGINSFVNPTLSKPYLIMEGICNDFSSHLKLSVDGCCRVVYTGGISHQYGIPHLLEAFTFLDSNVYELYLCGTGSAEQIVLDFAKRHQNVHYLGQKTDVFCQELQNSANILINPRMNDSEYTKYSFPSKTLEYLATGNPVISYKLDGIPKEYDDVLIYPCDESCAGLAETIRKVFTEPLLSKKARETKQRELCEKKEIGVTVNRIVTLLEDKNCENNRNK